MLTVLLDALFVSAAVSAMAILALCGGKMVVLTRALRGELSSGIRPMVVRSRMQATGAAGTWPQGATIYRPNFAAPGSPELQPGWHGSLAA